VGKPNNNIFVLGENLVARTLSQVLRVPMVRRTSDDSGWDWNWDRGKEEPEAARLILVAGSHPGIPVVIRWHHDSWKCPYGRKLSCVIFGLDQAATEGLARRDVFARIGEQGDSFQDWADSQAGPGCIAFEGIATLASLLAAMASLNAVEKSAWSLAGNSASCLPALGEAIRRRDRTLLAKAIAASKTVDWDAICYRHPNHGSNAHAWAHQIRNWLATVTVGVAPDWDEGQRLLGPLLIEPTHSHPSPCKATSNT
jgi:hypothetical protein